MTDAATPMTDAQYQRQADAVLAAIERQLDNWLQDDVIDIDGRRTGGMLEMALPGGSSLIVNMQPPLQELWLAARAGGHHYRWVEGRWLDTRDGSEFFETLSRHATTQAGRALRFHAPIA
ncbi:MAG: iron donor protein CyaY [Aquabacterium sp.]